MFQLFEQDAANHFLWDSVGSVGAARENLGEDMPVFMYRLFQHTIKEELTRRFGKEATIDIFRKAGELSGVEYAKHLLPLDLPLDAFIAHLGNLLEEHKVGILRVEAFDPDTGKAILTLGEDLDCSGLPITGETVCNYDEGFFAGVLKTYTHRDYVVTEVDCWATGSRVCRFEAVVQESNP